MIKPAMTRKAKAMTALRQRGGNQLVIWLEAEHLQKLKELCASRDIKSMSEAIRVAIDHYHGVDKP